MENNLKVVFAGGGTGGHLYPALNLAKAMEEKWPVQFRFFGTRKGIEAKKVPEAGYELVHIPIAGFQRSWTLRNLSFPLRLWQSIRLSHRMIKNFDPHLVIGTGGYVMGPVLRAAIKQGYPTVIQEQNSYPGVTTRMLAKKADVVFVAYEETKEYLQNPVIVHSGNPIRVHPMIGKREDLLKRLKLDVNRKVILAFGGSQGSAHINKAIREILTAEGIPEDHQLLWQTGANEYHSLEAFVKDRGFQKVVVTPFIDPMYEAYHVAEFAICRSGAMTLSELMAYQIPGILVPLPHAAADHQYKNARAVEDKGGAVVVRDDADLIPELKRKWQAFVEGKQDLEAMKTALSRMYRADAIDVILDHIEELLSEKKLWSMSLN